MHPSLTPPATPERAPCRPCARVAALITAVLTALGLAACDTADPTAPDDLEISASEAPAPDLDASQSISAAVTRLPRSFFINPNTGSDANAGTSLKPFKTLARGLSTAIAGDTMRLATGVYGAASGEKFTTSTRQVSVPAGVKIFGTLTNAGSSRIQGAAGDLVGLDLKGGATVRNLFVVGFATGIRAAQGTQTLKTLELDQNTKGLELRGSAKATMTGSTVFVRPGADPSVIVSGASVEGQAQLIMDGGTITADGENCVTKLAGVTLEGAARLTMRNGAAMVDIAGNSIQMFGTSRATLTNSSISRTFQKLLTCSPLPSVIAQDSTTFTLKKGGIVTSGGLNSTGIQFQSRGLLTLDSTDVSGHSTVAVNMTNGSKRLSVTGSSFRGNLAGIDASNLPDVEMTITGSTFTQNGVAIKSPFLKLRNSKVTGNATGILITRSTRFSDLGQAGLPGGNTITGNSTTGVTFGQEVINAGLGAVFASGNTWNPLVQSADAGGHYPAQPLVTSDSPGGAGTNFKLPPAGTAGLFEIQL